MTELRAWGLWTPEGNRWLAGGGSEDESTCAVLVYYNRGAALAALAHETCPKYGGEHGWTDLEVREFGPDGRPLPSPPLLCPGCRIPLAGGDRACEPCQERSRRTGLPVAPELPMDRITGY